MTREEGASMARTMPRTELDTRFSSDGASPTEWAETRGLVNDAHNSHCILTTGCNAFGEGLDVVVEGDARHVTGDEYSQTRWQF